MKKIDLYKIKLKGHIRKIYKLKNDIKMLEIVRLMDKLKISNCILYNK